VYRSTFPRDPSAQSYLRQEGIISAEETAPEMVTRVVEALAAADRGFPVASNDQAAGFEERLGQELDAGRILLSPAIMANAGRDPPRPLATAAAPPVDLRGDLARVRTLVDLYHRAGMGSGFDLDGLEDPVAMVQYLNYVAAVGAGTDAPAGQHRTAHDIALLSLAHPRAEDFVASKVGAAAEGEVWRLNVALRVTDAEMQAAVRHDGRARSLLMAAAEAAQRSADLGLVFADRLEAGNPAPILGPYAVTSPCGALGLVVAETCVLGAVNLAGFYRQAAQTGYAVAMEALADSVYTLVRALDDAVEVGLRRQPTQLSTDVTGAGRKIAIGVCGLAELLATAGVPYDSVQAQVVAQEVLAQVNYASKLASVELGVSRGPCPVVARGRSGYADPELLRRFTTLDVRSVTTGDWAALADRLAESPMLRHVSTTAVPPTPHSGPLLGVSSGIDPTPAAAPAGPAWSVRREPTGPTAPSPAGNAHRRAGPPEPTSGAGPVRPAAHLSMIGAAQACIDEGVATTVHLPPSSSHNDVYDAFVAAWERRCKIIALTVNG
jgi:ribonucleoside-diphosphate reductase alpha chain